MTASIKQSKPFLLGVAGGSGSGKTYFARDLVRAVGPADAEIIFQDNFYIDQSQKFDFDGGSVNFDHPSSIDFDLLVQCLGRLKQGRETDIPLYDFSTHKRMSQVLKIEAKRLIIVDGILIFHSEKLRSLFDDMIFFDTPEDLRFQRRLDRDVRERGRTPEGVRNQFFSQVKPMHDQYVEPSRRHARAVISQAGQYAKTLDELIQRFGP